MKRKLVTIIVWIVFWPVLCATRCEQYVEDSDIYDLVGPTGAIIQIAYFVGILFGTIYLLGVLQ